MNATVTEAEALFANEQTGRIVCSTHGGNYLTAAHAAATTASSWSTPLGDWFRVTDEELIVWGAEFGEPMECEDCRSAARTARPTLTIVR